MQYRCAKFIATRYLQSAGERNVTHQGNIVRNLIIVVFLLISSVTYGGDVDLAKAANENPFHNGGLNPDYEGQKTALAGEVMEIKPTNEKFPVYKLNLRLEGINPIWVTSIAPAPGGEIKVGDMIIFKGFITSTASADPSGELEKLIKTKTLLMAIQAQAAK